MKIGLVGYRGSGKSTLFHWLTAVAPDPSLAHTTQAAAAPVPDLRIERLAAIYRPKKITLASLELVDTPGLARSHEGNAARLAMIREAELLVLVVSAHDRPNPLADLQSFEEDLLLADMDLVARRIEKLRDQVKKPRPSRDQDLAELAALEPLLEALESGKRLAEIERSPEQMRATQSFRLFSERPMLVVVNLAEDEADVQRFTAAATAKRPLVAVPLRLQLELEQMEPEQRIEFQQELGLPAFDRGEVLRAILHASGQLVYFTAGDKEVRSWLLPRGGTALDAAANVHTDLARGFIRAETIACDDLFRAGSERDAKAHNLFRQEPKDYVVKDGDVLLIRFSV
jgi:ribosome-binding ATPase